MRTAHCYSTTRVQSRGLPSMPCSRAVSRERNDDARAMRPGSKQRRGKECVRSGSIERARERRCTGSDRVFHRFMPRCTEQQHRAVTDAARSKLLSASPASRGARVARAHSMDTGGAPAAEVGSRRPARASLASSGAPEPTSKRLESSPPRTRKHTAHGGDGRAATPAGTAHRRRGGSWHSTASASHPRRRARAAAANPRAMTR